MQKNPLHVRLYLACILFTTILVSACSSDNTIVFNSDEFKIYPNRIEQGEFKAVADGSKEITSNYPNLASDEWKLKRKLFHYPSYESNHDLLNAVYNLSLEEIDRKIIEDSIFLDEYITTVELGYSSIFSLALIHPEVCKNSLIKRVKNDRIMQDPGTGGSWPIASDRLLWAIAAWEVYKATGDNDWLRKTYFIIKNSIEDDVNVIWDYHMHLFKGEASFLNWREQSYPAWMTPTDIYESYSLSNQVIHFEALQALINMGKLLSKDVQKYEHISEALKKSINTKFRLDRNKHFAQFLYKNSNLLSEHSDGLGESIANIWNVSNASANQVPVSKFGVACFHPQIPNIPSYHNNSIWPFVQASWNWAAAENGNTRAVLHGLAYSLRSSGLFLTNKKNFLMENGDFQGTEFNKDSDLLSASASLSNYLHVLMGIRLTSEQMEFRPVIPRELKGKQILSNLKYHNAILHVEVLGFGNKISSFTFDGTPYRRAVVPKNIEGHHKIVIKMNNQVPAGEELNLVDHYHSPATPVLSYRNNELQWNSIENAVYYKVYQNGELLLETKDSYMTDVKIEEPVEYCVQALDSNKVHSFLSKPVVLYESKYEKHLEAEAFQTNRKSPYIVLKKTDEEPYYFQVKAPRKGTYQISFLYANGNGDFDNGDMCVSRSLWQNNGYLGSIVFPQRGKGNWNEYGYSNSFQADLKKGYNFFKISFEEFNNNMNGQGNAVRIDKIRLLRLK
ncbi:glycogen debranching protein [Marinifilum caeruleilacunae]|uniref:Glycogen debranching protein n=1 Tax=Marinifilum caeruleilacunae TaxID=2499076 RepID=A0ABX1WXS7_9BACT|nr:glycogen debranching protein [Marinifilum caeruleilacunae]NOU60948.1 glycogen debranching protein [Marinifilum caeruleilacunae]